MLYPAIVAPLFHLANLEVAYQAIRIINLLVFISSAIPAIMIGRLLLPGEFIVHSLLAVAVVASPFRRVDTTDRRAWPIEDRPRIINEHILPIVLRFHRILGAAWSPDHLVNP